ncbi:MAG: hypothetical protein OXF05_07875, partial [Hyphomicrobiales bacterium]|nr:hypothetical protein [Hyphomicrobiales bacterium]
LNFTINPDTIPEDDETIVLTLSAEGGPLPGQWTFGSTRHTITILANDSSIGFSTLAPASLAEQSSPHSISVELSAPGPQGIALVPGITGTDYSGATITSPASDASFVNEISFDSSQPDSDNDSSNGYQQTITLDVTVTDDGIAENEETFTITLTPASSSTIPESFTENLTYTFTVPAHDNTVTFEDTSPASVTEEGSAVEVDLKLTNPVPVNYNVSITQDGGDGNELTISPNPVMIMAGESTASFMVSAGDDADTNSETVTLTLNSSQVLEGWMVPANTTHQITITDNDAPTGAIGFAEGMSTVEEPDAGNPASHNVEFVITGKSGMLVSPDTLDVMLTIELGTDVTEGTGGDVAMISRTLQIDSTEFDNGSLNHSISILPDDTVEGDETVTLKLTQEGLPPGWRLGTTTEHIVTIPENDQPVAPVIGFAEAGATVPEPIATTDVSHNVPLDLTVRPSSDISVAFIFTTANAAMRNDGVTLGDYTAGDTHTIRVSELGGLTASYPVTIHGENTPELLESFTITFADTQPGLPDDWTVDPNNKTYRVTIPANDNTVEFASTTQITLTELAGDNNSAEIDITINQPLPSGTNATVEITHTSGAGSATQSDYTLTATGGAVYDPATGILTLPEMQGTVTLTLTAAGDDGTDPGEAFLFGLANLSNAAGWIIGGKNSIRIDIEDDTPTVTGTIGFAETDMTNSTNLTNVTESGTLRLTVEASSAPDMDIPVDWQVTTRAGDVTPDDGNITISSGQTQATFEITADDDNATIGAEGPEEIIVTLSGSLINGFTFNENKKTHTFTIAANEQNTIGFASTGPQVVPEGDDVTLMLRIRDASGADLTTADIIDDIPLTFTYTETDGNNVSDIDSSSPESFSVTSLATVSGGILDVTPPVTIEDDGDHEGQETVTVTLGTGANFPGEWLIDNNKDTFTITIPASDTPVVENHIGFGVTTIDLYQGDSQVVRIHETSNTAFVPNINLVATIDNTNLVHFQGSSGPQQPLSVTLTDAATSFDLPALISASPSGTATVTLSIPSGEILPSGWGLDENRSILTVRNHVRTVAFAQFETDAFFSEGTVKVRLNIGGPAPDGLMVTVTTDDTGTITLPEQPMTVMPGANFHEFDVTIVQAARMSRIDKTVTLRLGSVTEAGTSNTWSTLTANHDLNLQAPDMVVFESFGSASVSEDAGTVSVRLLLTADAPDDFSVNLALDDAATYGNDVSVVAGSGPTFPSGANRATIDLSITDDSIVEGIEEVKFNLSEGTDFPAKGWVVDTIPFTLSIIDNDGDASGVISFASDDPSSLLEGIGPTVLRLSLGDGSTGSATVPMGGIGLSLSSSDSGRVAIPERWKSFTIPEGTSGEFEFTVNILGDRDLNRDIVTLTLRRGTDGANAGFPSGWSLMGGGAELTDGLTINDLQARRVVGFADPSPENDNYDNFDEENFRIDFAESSGTVHLPIRADRPALAGGLPLKVTIVEDAGDVFSFTQATGMTEYEFTIPENQTEYNLEIDIKNEDDETDDETGLFRLSLGATFVLGTHGSTVVGKSEITVRSIDDDSEEEGFVVFERVTESPFGDSSVEYLEPRDLETGSFQDSEFNTLAATRYVNLLFSALPRPVETVGSKPGFHLETTVSASGTAGATFNTSPGGGQAPDLRLSARSFIPIDDIQIRPNDFLYRLPITVFSEDSGFASDEERENFKIEIVEDQTFPPGIAGRRFPYTHLGTIVDQSGGQVYFGDRDVASGSKDLNPSRVDENIGTFNVRVHTTRLHTSIPVSWRIEKGVDADGNDLTNQNDFTPAIGGTVNIINTNFADFPITIVDDSVAEGDETYTLIIEEGSGFPRGGGRRIDPERNRYTFTIADNDEAPVFGFGAASTEATEDGNVIEIAFSLTENSVVNNSLIPAGGICLILETSGTANDMDVFHLDTSRTTPTAGPTPNCDPNRATNGEVDAAVGTNAIAEYIPAGETPTMRLRINDDTNAEIKEEITFTIRGANNGLPGGWQIGQGTHTVAIAANDNLISFASSTSSITEDPADTPSREVVVNILQAVPAEEIASMDKEIRLKVDIATLNRDTNDADDITLDVAPRASGSSSFDSGTGVLTVNAGVSAVPLLVTAVNDELNDKREMEQVTITLSEITGTPLPSGWDVADGANGDFVHTVSVADDDDAFVQIAETYYTNGFTITEASQAWVGITPSLIETTQGAPDSGFAVRVTLDPDSPYIDYAGIATTVPAFTGTYSNPVFTTGNYPFSSLSQVDVVFQGGQTSRSLDVHTSQNNQFEGTRSIRATLTPTGNLPSGWEIGERSTFLIHITDNDNGIVFAHDTPMEFNEGVGEVTLYLEATSTGVLYKPSVTRFRDAKGNILPERGHYIRLPLYETTVPSIADGVNVNFADGGPTRLPIFPAALSIFAPQYTFYIGEDDNVTNETFTYEIYSRPDLFFLRPPTWGHVDNPLRLTFTVIDNDPGGEIAFTTSESIITEAAGADHSTTVTVSINKPVETESTVAVRLSGSGGATSADYTITGVRYNPTNETLTLPANRDDVTFTITAVDDSVVGEVGETLTLTLEERPNPDELPTNWSISDTKNTHTITIIDDETYLGFAKASTTVFENAGRVEIELAVSGVDLTDLTTIDMGMSGARDDVSHGGTSLMDFEVGDLLDVTQGGSGENPRIVIDIDDDGDNEGRETVTFTLPSSITIGGTTLTADTSANTHMLIIEPSDGLAWFPNTANTDTVSEGGTSAIITVLLNGAAVAPTGGLPLELEIMSGNEGNLVSFSSGSQVDETTFRVAQGAGSHPVTVYINNNDRYDGDRDVVFALSGGTGFPTEWGTVAAAMAGFGGLYTLTVTEDDDPTIGFASAGQTVSEGNRAKIPFKFEGYTIPAGMTLPLEIAVDGMANISGGETILDADDPVASGDGIQRTFTLSLTASDNTDPFFNIDILANTPTDGDGEGDETLTFTLQDNLPSGTNLGIATHTITIPANGNSVSFSSTGSTVNEGPEAEATIRVSLTHEAPEDGLPLKLEIVDSSGNITTSDLVTFNMDGATQQNSHTFTIDKGEDSHDIDVYIIDNDTDVTIDNQTVRFKLDEADSGFPTGWGSVRTSNNADMFTLTVVDDDTPVVGTNAAGFGVLVPPFTTRKTVSEGDTSTTITVDLYDNNSLSATSAPTGGLPLKLAITSGNENNLVTFDSSGSRLDETTFRVMAGDDTTRDVTVYINNNPDDAPDGVIVFTLSADNSNNDFPTGWGSVDTGSNTFTLTVTDDDDAAVAPTIGFASSETKVFENAGSVSIELAVSGFDASLLGSVNMGM